MDRRQRKTLRAIYDAFESLMIKEHYSAVTVAQIIERADIGRSTFYAHFETKDELLDHICAELFEHIFEGVNTHCVTHEQLKADDLKGRLAHLLYHLRDTRSGICGKLLMEGEPHFTSHFRSRLSELFSEHVRDIPTDVPYDLMLAMHVSAYVQTITWWFERGCSDDPELVASWYMQM